jgi:hypothetical protein
VIGTERYSKAINDSRKPNRLNTLEDKSAEIKPSVDDNSDDDESDEKDIESERAVDGDISDDEIGSDGLAADDSETPKVAEAILEFLTERNGQGAKVADVKAYLETRGIMGIHEKTPGMTLYRLSKQTPPHARREGRT